MRLSFSCNRSSLSFTQQTSQGTPHITAPKCGWKPKVADLGVLWVEGSQGQWKAREEVRSQHFNREATHGYPQPAGWRKDQLMCRSQCTVKIKGLLLKKKKKYSEFPDIDSRTLNQGQGPSECEAHVTTQVTCLCESLPGYWDLMKETSLPLPMK